MQPPAQTSQPLLKLRLPVRQKLYSLSSNQTPNTTSIATGQCTTVKSPPLSALHTSICLLKTAITDISPGITTVEGHILFDEGTQSPLLLKTLQRLYNFSRPDMR